MGRAKYTVRGDTGIHMATKSYKDFGYTHFTGRKCFYGKTDAIVDQKIKEFEEAQFKEEIIQGRTFSKIAELWWDEKEPQLAINSRNAYITAKEKLTAKFGDCYVKEIKAQDIVKFLQMFKTGSQKTINTTRMVMKLILDYALIAGDIDINPCVGLPNVKGKPKQMRQPANEHDVKIIENCREESMMGRFHYFLLFTGLRRNEAVGIKEKDIDRINKTLTVRRSICFDHSIPVEKEPKTQAGIRTVELLNNVYDIIPVGATPDSYLFFPDGIPHEKAVEMLISGFRKEHGLSCTPHQLRHSYASLLHSAGIDVKDAQHLLGHSTVAMTQDVYTHLEKEHKKSVQDKLNAYVSERFS